MGVLAFVDTEMDVARSELPGFTSGVDLLLRSGDEGSRVEVGCCLLRQAFAGSRGLVDNLNLLNAVLVGGAILRADGGAERGEDVEDVVEGDDVLVRGVTDKVRLARGVKVCEVGPDLRFIAAGCANRGESGREGISGRCCCGLWVECCGRGD